MCRRSIWTPSARPVNPSARPDLIRACADISDGGLALAAFEMAVAAGVGVSLDDEDTAALFGEDQGRYLIACNFDQAEALMIAAVGRFGGETVRMGSAEAPLEELADTWRTAFARAVDGKLV